MGLLCYFKGVSLEEAAADAGLTLLFTKESIRRCFPFKTKHVGLGRGAGPGAEESYLGGAEARVALLGGGSSEESRAAATDVHTQFLGVNSRFLKNCVWTISR